MDIEITVDDFVVTTKAKQNNYLCPQISDIPSFFFSFFVYFIIFFPGSIIYKIFSMFLNTLLTGDVLTP